jgi:hypothetical protein
MKLMCRWALLLKFANRTTIRCNLFVSPDLRNLFLRSGADLCTDSVLAAVEKSLPDQVEVCYECVLDACSALLKLFDTVQVLRCVTTILSEVNILYNIIPSI